MAARHAFPLPEISVAVWTALLAGLVILGSDLMWVIALGDVIRDTGAVPHSIPFASAAQGDWHNPIAVSQVVLSLLHSAVPIGLAALQLLIVAATLSVVVAESRRLGGSDVRTAVVIALVVIGCATAFVVVRLPVLSLLPWVIATAMLRRQHARRSSAVWWLVPLYALWGNLHGGVLVGVAVLGVFLVASTGGGSWWRRTALAVAVVLSLFVTSAGVDTPAYYAGVLSNEAARRGTDLWAAPDVTNPLDLAMLGAATVLLMMSVGRGLPVWEWLATVGLVVATVMTARNGVWLLLFLAPAAAGLRQGRGVADKPPARPRWWWPVVSGAAVVSVAVCAWQLDRREAQVAPPGAAVVPVVRAVADGRAVLADEPVAESLAQAGVAVWAVNPIDAFAPAVQGQFLDFLHDGQVPAEASDLGVAVVRDELLPKVLRGGGWVEAARVDGYVVLTREP